MHKKHKLRMLGALLVAVIYIILKIYVEHTALQKDDELPEDFIKLVLVSIE